MGGLEVEDQEEVEEEEGEVERQRWMRWEAVVGEEVRREWMHGLVGGAVGVGRDWAGEAAAEQTCLAVMEGEVGVQRRALWRGEEVVAAGHLAPVQEEGEEEGRSCDVGVGEEGRLWMEVEVEELKRRKRRESVS